MSKGSQRKNEHLSLFEKYYDPNQKNDFDEIRLIPKLIPELALKDVDISTNCLNYHFSHSFFINAMTGGSDKAREINTQLANLSRKYDLAMAVGSQKIGIIDKTTQDSFTVVRDINPNGFIIANLSANQSLDNIKEAIKMIGANAIQLHVNSPQELVNKEGDRDFYLLRHLNEIVTKVDKPIILKSVGFGMSPADIKQLIKIGIKNFDVSGMGGTNFIKIENQQNFLQDWNYLEDFGLSTVESLMGARNLKANLIASGGIRNPLDVVKSFVLGAKLVGVSGTFIHLLIKKDPEKLSILIEDWIDMIPKIMLMIGQKSLLKAQNTSYIASQKLVNAVNFLDKSF